MNEIASNLLRIKNLVQEYYNIALNNKGKSLEVTSAKWVFLQLVNDVYFINKDTRKIPYKNKDEIPTRIYLAELIGVSSTEIIRHYFIKYKPTEQAKRDYILLRNYINDIIEGRYNQQQIKQMLTENKLTLTDVIDAVIDVNSLVGVGLITLSDGISEYIRNKIK